MGKRVYLGLGSNLGNKERIVRKAIDKVGERVGAVVAVSSFYKTAPWGYQSVHTFCNAAIAVDTDLSPEEVLFTVQEIERELGSKKHREGDGSYVDRLIDIDLLDYDGLVLDTHSLVLPHPYMHKRTFDDPACRNSSAMGAPGIGEDGNGAIGRFTERKVI